MKSTFVKNLAFLVLFATLTFLSGFYYVTETETFQSNERKLFAANAERSLIAIQAKLNQKKQLLDAYLAFFKSSEFISEKEFREFSSYVESDKQKVQLCWKSNIANEAYVLNTQFEELCQGLNFLDRSGLLQDREKGRWVMLSQFASTSSENQKGAVFLFFPLSALEAANNWEQLPYSDSLVALNGVSHDVFKVFQHGDWGQTTEPFDEFVKKAFSIGSFDFYYRFIQHGARWHEGEPLRILFVSSLMFLFGALLILFVRILIYKNSDIAEMVARRTEELRHSNEQLSQFAYRTSHDLKAPLISSRRLIAFILKDIESGNLKEAESNSKKVSSLMIQLETLVNDILSLVKSDLGSESSERVDLSLIVEGASEKLSALKHEKDCEILNETEGLCPILQKIRIKQVLENLISNGVKYSDSKKEKRFVRVKGLQKGKNLEILVVDNGVGIPADRQSEVFQMFKRFHPKLSFGSGLGMSISKKNVDAMGGKINFQSDSNGTTFCLTFPGAFEEPL